MNCDRFTREYFLIMHWDRKNFLKLLFYNSKHNFKGYKYSKTIFSFKSYLNLYFLHANQNTHTIFFSDALYSLSIKYFGWSAHKNILN